ncbi:MAG: hypothetical protein K1Y36_13345 [Blastocatellia bacterium]|nr:hypothetical protein [Blastocatellia bacterium]
MSNNPSAYNLRKYLEKHKPRTDQMLNMASPALNNGLPTSAHWEWLNVLLTRALSHDPKTGIGIRAKDEGTLLNSITPLIVRPKYIDYLEKEQILVHSERLLKKIQRTDNFDELVRNQLPTKRTLHGTFQQHSLQPELLTRNVHLNIEMHDKFEKLYGETIMQMQSLIQLFRTNRVDLTALPQDSTEVSIHTALEFIAKPDPWVDGDYAGNIANLQTVLRIRDMLQRAAVYYGVGLPSIDVTAGAVLIEADQPLYQQPLAPLTPGSPIAPTVPPLSPLAAPVSTSAPQNGISAIDVNLKYELEAELSACIQYLNQTAANSDNGAAIRVIKLSTGNMILTSWEAAVFSNNPAKPDWQLSFLARESRKLLQLSIALLAVIEQRRPRPTEAQKLTPGQQQAAKYYLEQLTEALASFDRFLSRTAATTEEIEILSNLRNTRRKLVMTQTQLKQVLGITG